MRPIPWVALLVMATAGCQGNVAESQAVPTPTLSGTPGAETEEYSLDSIIGKLQGGVQTAQEAVAPHAEYLQKRTADEVEKLFRWEYRVTEVPKGSTAAELEDRLSGLGGEGWECFDVYTSPEGIRITCKRRPRSALNYFKYVPGL